MLSLWNRRKENPSSRTNGDRTNTPRNAPAIIDRGIVVDHRQGNSYAVEDDLAPSELSSSAYGSPYHHPDTPSTDHPIGASSHHNYHQYPPKGSRDTTMTATPAPPVPRNSGPSQSKRSPQPPNHNHNNNVHAISYVTQAPEHGYSAGYEDDLSTLGDESIIRRGRQNQIKQQEQQLRQQQQQQAEKQQQQSKQKKKRFLKKGQDLNTTYDKTKIDKAHTRSTEEISPSSQGDLSFTFSNVLDVNEKIPDSSCLGYDITDDSLTDGDRSRKILASLLKGEGGDPDDPKKPKEPFIQRNKWTIIKFLVVLSLFLLMAAATVLVVTLLHMRNIANASEAAMVGSDSAGPFFPAPAPSSFYFAPELVNATDPVTDAPSVPAIATLDDDDFVSTTVSTEPPIPTLDDDDVVSATVSTAAPSETPKADLVVTQSPTKGAETDAPTQLPSGKPTTGTPTLPLTEKPTTGTPTPPPTEKPSTLEPTFLPTEEFIENGLGSIVNSAEQAKVGTDLRFVIGNYSPSSLPFLEDSKSAQAKAFAWMTRDPNYWDMEISTIVQRWTLAVVYYSTGGPKWKTEQLPDTFAEGKSPWLSYSDECLWESSIQGTKGRVCDTDNNYFAIHLRNVGLMGTLPAELGLLSDHMRLLLLNSNDLTGTLPSELGKLTALERINLQYNDFRGSLPSEIGQLSHLTIASLGNNQFSGTIPPETGSWGSMQTISLENNAFSGPLPREWADLPYLEELSIEKNFLTGTIPDDYNYMYQLTSLSLYSNDITGTMNWGLCPGEYRVKELKADCDQVTCDCCTECFTDAIPMGLGQEIP